MVSALESSDLNSSKLDLTQYKGLSDPLSKINTALKALKTGQLNKVILLKFMMTRIKTIKNSKKI